jgi:peptidoglycan/xylan/chitin deacetylase (PgdA/CDA1 family)
MVGAAAVIVGLPLFLGMGATLLFGRRKTSSSIPGLLFHSILPKPALGAEMSLYPLDRFEKFCIALKQHGYHGVTLGKARNASPTASANKPVLITFDDGLQSVYLHAHPVLERHGLKATVFCVGGLYGEKSSWDVFAGKRHLTREQIRNLATYGHEIGSHTCSHAYLPYLDDGSLRRELSDSKRRLEDIIGKEVTSLSFPFGGWNRHIWEIAQETGYRAATLYRGRGAPSEGLFPVEGVYRFDSVNDVLSKIILVTGISSIMARSRMMTHFARGTPIWKYRREYVYV